MRDKRRQDERKKVKDIKVEYSCYNEVENFLENEQATLVGN
jgi:hypothetical protein